MGQAEQAAVASAVSAGWVAAVGPGLGAFEQDFAAHLAATNHSTSKPHCLAVSSGTAALHLALLSLGVGRGDHVLVPTATFVAPANAVRYVGATPVFVDAAPTTWTLDPDLVQQALKELSRAGEQAKAVIAVDIYGQCADYAALRGVCAAYGVHLIQDAAEALGATYRGHPAGGANQAEVATFSFNGNKIITAGGGGMVVFRDEALLRAARSLATQARQPALHYEHHQVGYNYRLSAMQAALGRVQLRVLAQRVEARRTIFARYRCALPQLQWMPEAPFGRASRWLTCALLPADAPTPHHVCEALATQGIEARPLWKPMHQQPVFQGCGVYGGAVAEGLFQRGIALPSSSTLSPSAQQRVVDEVAAALGL